jgi:hypothetical protein
MARARNVTVINRDASIALPVVHIPEGWPDEIYCPGCQTFHPTSEFRFLGRKEHVAHLLYRIIACPKTNHAFAPREEYFALTARRGE